MRARVSGRLLAIVTTALMALTTVPAEAAGSDPGQQTAPAAARGVDDPPGERWLEARLQEIRRVGGIGVVAEVRTPSGSTRGAVGHARRTPNRPARDDAEFRAASVNKMLTAVLALQLVERGRWSLDTTIGDVLPHLWPSRSDVTLRQLLSHTSGMPDHLGPLLAEADSVPSFVRAVSRRYTDRELVRAARTLPWLFEPGTDMAYSNTNYVVVGMMVKRVTGQPMNRLLRERVLWPARMTQSRFGIRRGLQHPSLREYARLGDEVVDLGSFHPSIFSSAGALVTTTRDLSRFHHALSRGRLLRPSTVRQMRSVVSPGEQPGTGYGLGSLRLPDPCRPGRFLHGHDGATYGTLTMSFSTPDGAKRVTVAMTGRTLGAQPPDVPALLELVFAAMARTCGASIPGGLSQRLPRGYVPNLPTASLPTPPQLGQ